MDTPDPTIRAALEAGLDETWGMSEAQFHDALRRYDAIRFKELHEQVESLTNRLALRTMERNEARSEATTTQDALKAERKVRGMLVKVGSKECLCRFTEGPCRACVEWSQVKAAAQALDKKEG